jgi:hypothetical protein
VKGRHFWSDAPFGLPVVGTPGERLRYRSHFPRIKIWDYGALCPVQPLGRSGARDSLGIKSRETIRKYREGRRIFGFRNCELPEKIPAKF